MKTYEAQKLIFDLLSEAARRLVSSSALTLLAVFLWGQLQGVLQLAELPRNLAYFAMSASLVIAIIGLAALAFFCALASLFSFRQLIIAIFGQSFSLIEFVAINLFFHLIVVAVTSSLVAAAIPIIQSEISK